MIRNNTGFRFRNIETRLNSVKPEITPEGFWLYRKVKIARSGLFPWYAHELERDGIFKTFPELSKNDSVELMRTPESFTPEVVASMNGKSFTFHHPKAGLVHSRNYKEEEKGSVFNAFFELSVSGGDSILYADILVKDEKTQKAIESGIVEVSIGYFYEKPVKFEKNLNFVAYEIIISMNHLALVPNGRAGPLCRLNKKTYKTGEEMEEIETKMTKLSSSVEDIARANSVILELMKDQARINKEKEMAEKKKKRLEREAAMEKREHDLKKRENEFEEKEKNHKEKEDAHNKRENELSDQLKELESRKNDIFFTPEESTSLQSLLKMVPGDQITAFYDGKFKKGDQGTLKTVVESAIKVRANEEGEKSSETPATRANNAPVVPPSKKLSKIF